MPSTPARGIPPTVRRAVDGEKLGFVATVGPDGAPSVSPKGTLSVWDRHHLVFADLASPGTVANLERDPRVEVNVVDPFARKGWRFRGRARVLHDGPEFERAVRFFSRRDVVDAPRRIRSVVWIRVEGLRPLISPAYSMGSTEPELRKEMWEYFRRRERGITTTWSRRPRGRAPSSGTARGRRRPRPRTSR